MVFEKLGVRPIKWSHVLGPVSALCISIERLNWIMPNFVTTRDRINVDILLKSVRPTPFKDIARRHCVRLLECSLASEGGGGRTGTCMHGYNQESGSQQEGFPARAGLRPQLRLQWSAGS